MLHKIGKNGTKPIDKENEIWYNKKDGANRLYLRRRNA